VFLQSISATFYEQLLHPYSDKKYTANLNLEKAAQKNLHEKAAHKILAKLTRLDRKIFTILRTSVDENHAPF